MYIVMSVGEKPGHRGRKGAGDKHEAADSVPAAAPALCLAAHTLTAGCV